MPNPALRGYVALATVIMLGALGGCTPSRTAARPTPNASSSNATVAAPPSPAATLPEPTPSATPTPYPRLPIPAGTPRCHTFQLEVAYHPGGAAAGHVVADFELRNRSKTACWVYGWVGFQMLDARGRAMPERLEWTTELFFGNSEEPTRILLPPGTAPLGADGPGHAFFNTETDDVTCNPTVATAVASLEIWPPDEVVALVIPARSRDGLGFVSCGGIGINPLQVQPHPSFG